MLELPGGCLCCAVREDLARTLRNLIDRRDAGEIRAVSPHRRRNDRARRPGADPVHARQRPDARPRGASRPCRHADRRGARRRDARPFRRGRAASCTRRCAGDHQDRSRPARPRSRPPASTRSTTARRAFSRATRASRARCCSASPRQSPMLPLPSLPPAHHTHGIDAFALILEGEISRLDFARALGGLAGERGNDLLRVKGIVRFADRPERPAVVQAAQHALFAPEWLDDWPDDDHRSRLVFVVHDIPRAEILEAFRLRRTGALATATIGEHRECSISSSRAARPSCHRAPSPPTLPSAASRSRQSARPAASPRSAPAGPSTPRARS